MKVTFDHFDALAELIDDPYPFETARTRVRRMVLQVIKVAEPSLNLINVVDKFVATFDMLVFSMEWNVGTLPTDAQYIRENTVASLAGLKRLCRRA